MLQDKDALQAQIVQPSVLLGAFHRTTNPMLAIEDGAVEGEEEEPGEQEVKEAEVDEKEEVHFEQPALVKVICWLNYLENTSLSYS